jgi:hypothetical protein
MRITAARHQMITRYSITTEPRSIAMYTMYEALAREHQLRRERQPRDYRLASELAAERRWRRLERWAHVAQERHAERVHRAAQAAHKQ